jgi:hypothetical protein
VRLDLGAAAIVEAFALSPVRRRAPVRAAIRAGGCRESSGEDSKHGVSFPRLVGGFENAAKRAILRLRKILDV